MGSGFSLSSSEEENWGIQLIQTCRKLRYVSPLTEYHAAQNYCTAKVGYQNYKSPTEKSILFSVGVFFLDFKNYDFCNILKYFFISHHVQRRVSTHDFFYFRRNSRLQRGLRISPIRIFCLQPNFLSYRTTKTYPNNKKLILTLSLIHI